MRTNRPTGNRGIALIIVMVVITVFSIMVATFAYSMKVETRLARNSGFDTQMDWLGRSGIELAKYVLGQQRTIPNEPYDSLNQKWAGGPGNSNSVLADVRLDNIPIGPGTISVKITDCERKININTVEPLNLTHALTVIGVDAAETPGIVASIQNWISPNRHFAGGADSSYYESLDPPYTAKRGPIDDISELLLIRGITPELYWGPRNPTPSISASRGRGGLQEEIITYPIGMVDVFSPFGGRMVNINTASSTVLQMFPEVTEEVANAIIQFRAGPDGVDGTEDDMPIRNVAQLSMVGVPGMPREMMGSLARYFTTQSFTFEVEVKVQVNQVQRTYYAIIRRVDTRTLQTLNVWSK